MWNSPDAEPALSKLRGHNPWTVAIVVVLVPLHVVMALLSARLPWYGGLLCGACVGSLIAYGLLFCMHEASHRLVFEGELANRAVFVAANMPLGVLFAFPMADWHLVHHRERGKAGVDPYEPAEWERGAFLDGSRSGRLAWHVLFAPLQLLRVFRAEYGGGKTLLHRWVLVDVLAQVVFGAVALPYVPFPMLCYLAVSLLSLLVLHPVNPWFLEEHYAHPDIPWNRLPQARRQSKMTRPLSASWR